MPRMPEIVGDPPSTAMAAEQMVAWGVVDHQGVVVRPGGIGRSSSADGHPVTRLRLIDFSGEGERAPP